MKSHPTVSRQEWIDKRTELLKKEKELTKQRDQLSNEIRNLPWVKIDKDYIFEDSTGKKSFADLFQGKNQLVVYHFMLGPNWKEGCKSCSFWADNYENITIHLSHRNVRLVSISRAPIDQIESFRKRMGWTFPWYSSYGSDYNFDFHVSFKENVEGEYNYKPLAAGAEREYPGISVFYKDAENQIFHTYSRYARGLDLFNTAYHYLDIVPEGRNEKGLPYGMAWVKHRDRY